MASNRSRYAPLAGAMRTTPVLGPRRPRVRRVAEEYGWEWQEYDFGRREWSYVTPQEAGALLVEGAFQEQDVIF